MTSAQRRQNWLLATPVIALLLWTVIYPNAAVIAGSFENGLGHWREFIASPADREALRTSIVISVASVFASLAIGVPLAFLLGRFEFPGRRLLRAVATLPAALPPLVGVIAFLFLYGESGVVTRAIQRSFGMAEAPWRLQGIGAIVFVHAYTMYVYVFLFVSAGLERFDATLDEAASGLGASTWQRLRRVTLPLLMPAVAGSMLLVFMNALGSFSAPYVFGGGLRVLSTQILASKTNGAMGLAYVETTVLALSAVAGLALFTNSVSMALIATAGNLIVCFIAAYLIVFRRFAGRRLLELLVALPWAIPATAIALGLAATFNRNDLLTGRVLLVGTFWILPLAYFIRDTPLVSSAVESSLRQMDASLEDAARGLGASWLLTMRRVILPAARPGLVAGGLLAAVTAVGEFVASVVLYTHSNRPISMEILAQLRALAFGTAAAYSVLLIFLVLLMTLAARSFEERLA